MILADPAADVSLLAVATTVHVALAALRHHRHAGVLTVASVALATTPWVMPSLAGLATGLGLHTMWFAVCERWARHGASARARAGTVAPAASTPRPATAAAPAPARRPGAATKGPGPKGFVQAPVLSVLDESPDIRTFRMLRPEGFDFQPGQFLTVRLRTDGRELVRCYSISSPPAATGYLEISVKRQGVVSNALHAAMRPGSLLAVRAPAGVFTYPAQDDRPLALFAGGIGITPLMSMLRHAILSEPARRVTLVYSARREADFAFRDELSSIARRHPQVRVCLAASRDATSTEVYPGRIDEALIVAAVPDVAHGIALLCGPQSMIDGVSATLAGLGLARSEIRSELFEAAVASSSRPRGTHTHVDAPPAGPADTAAGAGFEVHATRCQRKVACEAGQTLLDVADAHGLEIPSLCRAGVCGTCRTRVLEGDVECSSSLLDDEDRAAGYVLACVASPRSDCTIEA